MPDMVCSTVCAPLADRVKASLALFADSSACTADFLEEAPNSSTVEVVLLTESACSAMLASWRFTAKAISLDV